MSGSRASSGRTRALACLLAGDTVAGAAQHSGTSERSIYRFLKEPGFRSELQNKQAVILERASGALVALSEEAVRALVEVLSSPSEPGANNKRLTAVSVLELALNYREYISFEERLSRLEREVYHEEQREAVG